MDLGPTEGCREAIKCLQMHCQLVKGSTNKEVLEVFYQEIGFRLIAYAVLPYGHLNCCSLTLHSTAFCKSTSSDRSSR